MKNKPNIVLDTNILLVSIFETSQYYWVLDSLDKGKYDLFFSNEMLTEYDEVLTRKYNPSIAHKALRYILSLNNVYPITVYYHWNLLNTDSDDNKFVDCAIAANADYLVTNDNDYNMLNDIEFPKVRLLKMNGFHDLLKALDE